MTLQHRMAQARMQVLLKDASNALASLLGKARLGSMSLFPWATAEPLAIMLTDPELGIYSRFVPGRVILQRSAERVLAVAALHTFAAAVSNADIGARSTGEYIRACRGDSALLTSAWDQCDAIAARDTARAAALLAALIDDELCHGGLEGDRFLLTVAWPAYLSMSVETAVRASG